MKKKGEKATEEQPDVVPEDEEATTMPRASEKKLRDALRRCERERKEYLEGWQRAKADYVNARKQHERERSHRSEFVESNLLHDLFSVLDNFEMALSEKGAVGNDRAEWQMGIARIHQQLVALMRERGIEEIHPLETAFDPKDHESIGTVPVTDERKDGMVVSVVRRGYKTGDRVLRPAVVEVGEYRSGA